uniref:Uncharacterized protein n=1 Tax=uncultured prokaryote TaxID=198431 RepID=A0A0H5PWQ8_9ZZZZ|nr:hypothetical protein [uncultured prokaryote]
MYRVVTVFTGTPVSDGISTVHYDAAESTPGEAVAHQAALLGTWSPFVASAQNWTVSGTVDLIDETTGVLIDSTSGPDFPVDTTASDAPLPPTNQLLIRLGTGTVVGGRRLKGRMFLPGFTELANVSGGTVDPALISGSTSDLGDFVSGGDARPCVWHRPNDDGPGSKAQITSASIWTQWAVLRQRRPDA